MSTTVIQFPSISKRKRASADSETFIASPQLGTENIEQGRSAPVRVEGTAALAPIPIDILYPATEANRHDLIQALRLLPQAITALENARDAVRSNDVLQSDHQVHAVQMLLPELFRCRTIGDGFGAIVNALEIAFVNQQGEPLVENQIMTVLRVLKELRSRPFMSFESTQQTIDELEKVGLRVDPVTLGELLDAAT
jgi:hypothetical protein